MSIEILCGNEQAVGAVRRHLYLDSCSSSESRFEILRSTVWSIAAPSGKVHVNRLLSVALPTWQLLSGRTISSKETLRAELLGALSTLQDAGDLISLSCGYWTPAATRFVMLPGQIGYLLIGGAPSALLQLDNGAIQFHGPYRHLAHLPAELKAELPTESFDSWTKRPRPYSLQEWARVVFKSFEQIPYTPSNAEVFEFYLPANSRSGTPQYFRWSERLETVTGTLLARRRRLYGAREFRLVNVLAGRIVSACELHDVDIRRLMYALDLEANNPVQARPIRVGDRTQWLFTSELPRAEQRAFAAFGILTIPSERHFERRWTFMRNEELALGMLGSLGIDLGPRPREDY